LTRREAEILSLIAAGATNSEIADHLVLSGHTVKSHITRIFTNTESRNHRDAIQFAHEYGLIQ